MENKTAQFRIRPARPDEAGLFFTQHTAENERLGAIGHIRMDFGKSDSEFWHARFPGVPGPWRLLCAPMHGQYLINILKPNRWNDGNSEGGRLPVFGVKELLPGTERRDAL